MNGLKYCYLILVILFIKYSNLMQVIDQSVGAVEYNDCISTEG